MDYLKQAITIYLQGKGEEQGNGSRSEFFALCFRVVSLELSASVGDLQGTASCSEECNGQVQLWFHRGFLPVLCSFQEVLGGSTHHCKDI